MTVWRHEFLSRSAPGVLPRSHVEEPVFSLGDIDTREPEATL